MPEREKQGKSVVATARIFQRPGPKKAKQRAARELLRIVEENMERKGLSEEEKNSRAESFIAYVDAVNADHAK
jgi:hypothetical protein